MAFKDFFTGRDPSMQQVSTVSPQQQQFMNQLLQQLGPQVGQAFDFNPIAQAATQRFQQQTLPSIAERFAGMNAKRSSGYGQALANAQENLQTQLAGQQAQFGLQSQSGLAKLLGLGLQPQFENLYDPGAQSGFSSLLQGSIPAAIKGFASGGLSLPFDFMKLFGGMMGNQEQQEQQQQSPTTNTQARIPIRPGGYGRIR